MPTAHCIELQISIASNKLSSAVSLTQHTVLWAEGQAFHLLGGAMIANRILVLGVLEFAWLYACTYAYMRKLVGWNQYQLMIGTGFAVLFFAAGEYCDFQ